MKIRKKRKFVSSIFAGNLAMIIIPMVIVAFLTNYSLHQYLMTDIAQKDKMMIYSVKQNLESFLQDAVDTLEYIDIIGSLESKTDLNSEIERINQIDGYYENIEILDAVGIVLNTLPSNERQLGHNRSGEDYFKYISRQDIYWSAPFISSVSGEPTVTLALKKQGRIIVGYLSLKDLSKLTDKFTEADPDVTASIVDSYGTYISSFRYDLVSQRQLDPNFSLIGASSSAKWPSEFIKGGDQIGFSIKTTMPEWYIVLYDDYKNSMKNIDALLYLFLSLFFASVVVFIILTLLRSRTINQNIEQFIKQTEIIAGGKFEIELSDQKYDEFDKLVKNFKLMTENLKSRDEKLEFIAYTDSLTGISNRMYLYNSDWRQKLGDAEVFGLIFLDIDNFKNINDSYGHLLGDQLLIETSRRLRNCLGEIGIPTRFGGDEFVIVVPDRRDRQTIVEVIHLIMDSFKKPIKIDHHSFVVTVSMGICVEDRKRYDLDQMLKAADIAMYQVKSSGKNDYKFYSPEMDKKVKKRLEIEQNLRNALENDEFTLVYQPQVFAKDSRIRGFEALLRWSNQELGPVGPMDFIPIAEETGIIVRIGEWVFRNACETIKRINDLNNTDYMISVNVSPVQINSPHFLRNLYEIIEETGVRKEWIEVEITENVFLSNIEEVTTKILHLTLNRISVSLDDFGTGYSSLSYLNKLPINTLKIDREFIQNLNNDNNNEKMIDSIILLAHKLGIILVAEGVENKSQVEILNGYLCDCIQGFYFSRPLDIDELSKYIERSRREAEAALEQETTINE